MVRFEIWPIYRFSHTNRKFFFGRFDPGKKCTLPFLMLILTHVSIFKLVGNSGSNDGLKLSRIPWGHPLTLTLTLTLTLPSVPGLLPLLQQQQQQHHRLLLHWP